MHETADRERQSEYPAPGRAVSTLAEALDVAGGVVAAVGAGGKKSVLQALAREAQGRVGLTATVHVAPFPEGLATEVMIDAEPALRERAPAWPGPGVLAYAQPADKPGRLAGLSPAAVAAIHAAGGFDLTLVKADGARMRGVKAPKPDEPVLPPGTARVLLLVSAAAIGAPLDERIAHRPERLAAVAGAAPGEPLTVAHLARLLTAEEGGLQGTAGLPVTLVINQVDDAAREAAASELARRVLAAGASPERVVLTCLRAAEPVIAVYERGAL